MAADDDSEPGCGRINFKFFYIVDDIDSDSPNLDDRSFRKPTRPLTSVIVASDCNDRSYRLESLDHFGLAYVPHVDDQSRMLDGLKCLWSKQAVSIRNDADEVFLL